MKFNSGSHIAEDFLAAQEFLHSRNMTDGMPVVPPTRDLVKDCLNWAMLSSDQLIGIEPVREQKITAEKLAINAVMAGCLPIHFPVVVTAFTAMLQEPFLLHGATASTGGCAVLIVINGPMRKELGMSGTFNALGSSDRATTVIGRAIRLILLNLLEVRPGDIDRSTLGHPGKFSYCIAEDEENTNWRSLSEEKGIPKSASAVTVLAAGAPRQIMNEWTKDPEEILETFIEEIKANMRHYSIWPGNYAIVIPPQLREHFENKGWTKLDIRRYVYEYAKIKRRDWNFCGKGSMVLDKGDREYRALTDENSLLVVAAGGPAGGFGAVIPPWFGPKSQSVSLAVNACVDCEM